MFAKEKKYDTKKALLEILEENQMYGTPFPLKIQAKYVDLAYDERETIRRDIEKITKDAVKLCVDQEIKKQVNEAVTAFLNNSTFYDKLIEGINKKQVK